jgi:hypothetical protein
MAAEQETPFRLDDEQRARVRDCLSKEALSLPPDRLEQFIGGIEASISHFRATPPEGSFRDTHDALRALWTLVHEDDPPIGQLKARLARLPPEAREYIGRRAPTVMGRLGFDLGSPAGELPDHAFDRFLQWTKTPEASQLPEPPPPLPKALAEKLAAFAGTEPVSLPPLVTALRVFSSNGGRPVEGRSRGGGKRSGLLARAGHHGRSPGGRHYSPPRRPTHERTPPNARHASGITLADRDGQAADTRPQRQHRLRRLGAQRLSMAGAAGQRS